MATQYPPDFRKVENLLKKLVYKDTHEEKVIRRYEQLAGLIRNGEMVNKDKEDRARTWVAEQEKIAESKKQHWHQSWCDQVATGLLITILGGLILAIIVSIQV